MNQVDIKKIKSFEHITIEEEINREKFYKEYVNKDKPVVIRGLTKDWHALDWNTEYFKSKEEGKEVSIKVGKISEGKREKMQLSTYVELLDEFEQNLKMGLDAEIPGYLHDIPLFYMFPEYLPDILPFPKELLPKWYRNKWQNYIQFFMGSTGSLTPLHFDTLLTNNLFFQVVGRKKFILIEAAQKKDCYIKGWRWAKFDPQNPDYEKFPKAKNLKIKEALLEPGDILYMPAGMLHQVHGLSKSISFNIDWHTKRSARKGVATLWKGAPRQNVFYNALIYAGLALGVPEKIIFPLYKSYLNYIS
ncbi:Cupin-like domain-containing protein [Tenacibaculum sp. 190524A02b]|uniref:Lysine-specific demethylase 8 n=1 Tax=Tenacibaculum vairaonense TaxID=3137860 RepID=A0ABP1FE57_9FLAO